MKWQLVSKSLLGGLQIKNALYCHLNEMKKFPVLSRSELKTTLTFFSRSDTRYSMQGLLSGALGKGSKGDREPLDPRHMEFEGPRAQCPTFFWKSDKSTRLIRSSNSRETPVLGEALPSETQSRNSVNTVVPSKVVELETTLEEQAQGSYMWKQSEPNSKRLQWVYHENWGKSLNYHLRMIRGNKEN